MIVLQILQLLLWLVLFFWEFCVCVQPSVVGNTKLKKFRTPFIVVSLEQILLRFPDQFFVGNENTDLDTAEGVSKVTAILLLLDCSCNGVKFYLLKEIRS